MKTRLRFDSELSKIDANASLDKITNVLEDPKLFREFFMTLTGLATLFELSGYQDASADVSLAAAHLLDAEEIANPKHK